VSESLAAAGRYAWEAVRLLRRNPSLLLVALAMAFVTWASWRSGPRSAYPAAGASAPGKGQARIELLREAVQRTWHHPLIDVASVLSPPTEPGLSLSLPSGLSLARRVPPGPHGSRHSGPALFAALLRFLFVSLIGPVVSVIVAGGYLGAMWLACEVGRPGWRHFPEDGRRFFWRLAAVLGLEGVLGASLGLLLLVGYYRGSVAGATMAVLPCLVLSFVLRLTRFIVVADDTRFVPAMCRSVATIWGNLPTALALTLPAGLVSMALARPLLDPVVASGFTASASRDASHFFLSYLPASVIATWVCAAMFTWYREVRAGAAAPQAAGTSTPVEETSAADGRVVCEGCGRVLPSGVNACPDCNADPERP
jgi:hypothetical protein